MNDQPALVIAGALVDVRNINTHKVVRLSIEVPAERAGAVLQAFGWPTGVDPIPVAIARLVAPAEKLAPHAIEGGPSNFAKEAAIIAGSPFFRTFLGERYLTNGEAVTAERATDFIRSHCRVHSRRALEPGTPAGNRFRDLRAEYEAWKHVA